MMLSIVAAEGREEGAWLPAKRRRPGGESDPGEKAGLLTDLVDPSSFKRGAIIYPGDLRNPASPSIFFAGRGFARRAAGHA
jgi:hypothetical protein